MSSIAGIRSKRLRYRTSAKLNSMVLVFRKFGGQSGKRRGCRGLRRRASSPKNRLLRQTRPVIHSVLLRMSPLFGELSAAGGRPSIPCKHLLKSSPLMAICVSRWVSSSTNGRATTCCSTPTVPGPKRPALHSMRGQRTCDGRSGPGLRHPRLRLGRAQCGDHAAQPAADLNGDTENKRGCRDATHGRTTRQPSNRPSQRRHKLVEGEFGWIRTVRAWGKLRYLRRARNRLRSELTTATYPNCTGMGSRADIEPGITLSTYRTDKLSRTNTQSAVG